MKKAKRCLGIILAMVIVLTEIVPINAKAVEEQNEALPFSLEVTDEGVEDAEVIAKKLVITNENASIVDTGITDLVVVKEIVHSVQAKVYLVSSQGVLHTFLVDADDPWLEKIEGRDLSGNSFRHTNDVFQRLRYRRKKEDAFDNYQHIGSGCYEDTLIQVLNPKGKYDLLNLSTGKYFSYNS